MTIDETPKHLHSRTRKRFKVDRPDDQTIYGEPDQIQQNKKKKNLQSHQSCEIDKTLRWLFSAQKKIFRPDSSPSPSDSTLDDVSAQPTPDPNQQTLRKFFQRSTPNVPLNACNGPASGQHFSSMLSGSSSGSHSNSGCLDSSMDMDMDVDMDHAGDNPSLPSRLEKVWVGGIGWM